MPVFNQNMTKYFKFILAYVFFSTCELTLMSFREKPYRSGQKKIFFLDWDSLHARLNSHYEVWSYKKKKHKKVKAYRKSVKKEPTVKRYLLILATKIIGQRKAFYRQRIPKSSCARKETVDIDVLVTSRNRDRKIMQSIRITSRPPSRIRKWNQLSQFR